MIRMQVYIMRPFWAQAGPRATLAVVGYFRPFYPQLATFYGNVRAGRIESPLPMDAVDGLKKVVRAHCPQVFDSAVPGAIDRTKQPLPEIVPPTADGRHAARVDRPKPPKDPLGDTDTGKAHEFTIASVANRLWKALLEGDKIGKGIKGWQEAKDDLVPYVIPILDWLRRMTGGS